MIKLNVLGNIAILVDFDGTITSKDTNVLLVKRYMNDAIKHLLEIRDKLNYMEYLDLLFKEIKISEKEYINLILERVQIAEGFIDFYNNIKNNNIPFAILSGGFDNAIIPLLGKYDIKDINVYANTLKFDGCNITVNYFHGDVNCCDMGPCGNCKVKHFEKFKEDNYKVIFIGDGFTDRAIAEKADIVFAKDGLLKYCSENDINCIEWTDFNDINKVIFNTMSN